MDGLLRFESVPFYAQLGLHILLREPPKGIALENLPDPFLSLPRMDPTGRWLMGSICTDAGQKIFPVLLRVLRDSIVIRSGQSANNHQIELLWQQEKELFARSSKSASGLLRFSSFEKETGQLVKILPLLFCKRKKLFFHPICPQCGKKLTECRDDNLLRKALLQPFSKSLQRYLYCPDCSLEREYRPAFYARDLTASDMENSSVTDRLGLMRLWTQLLKSDSVSKAFPCLNCSSSSTCFPADQKIGESARLLVPLSFYNFFLIIHRFASLDMDHASDLLGGLPVDEFLDKMKESRDEVQVQTAQSLVAQRSTSSFYFLARENASCSALNEILALKLSLFYEVVSCIKRAWEFIGRPLLTINPESFGIGFLDDPSITPIYWSSTVAPIHLSTALSSDPVIGNFTDVQGKQKFSLNPLFVTRPEYSLAEAKTLNNTGYGNLLVKRCDKTEEESAFRIDAMFQTSRSVTLEPLSYVKIHLGLEQGFKKSLPVVFEIKEASQKDAVLTSVPFHPTPDDVQLFEFLTSQPPFEVPFEVLPSYGLETDLYSLGILALRFFLANRKQTLNTLLDIVERLKTKIPKNVKNGTLSLDWKSIVEKENPDTSILTANNLSHDPEQYDSSEVDSDLWNSLIDLIFNLIFSFERTGYLRNDDAAVNTIWNNILADLESLKNRAVRTFISSGEPSDLTDENLKAKTRRSALFSIFNDLISDNSWLESEKEVSPIPEKKPLAGEKPSAEDTLTIPPEIQKEAPPVPPPESADRVSPQSVPSLDETIVLPSSPKKAIHPQGTSRKEEDEKDLQPDKFMETVKQKEKKNISLDETIVIPRKPKQKKDL